MGSDSHQIANAQTRRLEPTQRSAPVSPLFRFGAIILAAGPSSRMGTPKQLLTVLGKPLLVHAIEATLASPAWPVIVVLGAHAEQIRPALARLPIIVVENPAWAEGMASSLRAGIVALQQFSRSLDAALVALCDQPAFSARVIEELFAKQKQSGWPVVAARYANRQGAPALFSRTYFPLLATLTGEEGARALLNGSESEVTSVNLPELGLDLDTPSDLAAYTEHRRP